MDEKSSYQVGRLPMNGSPDSPVACSYATFTKDFDASQPLKILTSVEVSGTADSIKVVLDIRNVTTKSFLVCANSVFEDAPIYRNLVVNWLALQTEEPWIQTGTLVFSQSLVFLDGHCDVLTDPRAADSERKVVILPAIAVDVLPEYGTLRRGSVRWVEKYDLSRFSYCMQRVVSAEDSEGTQPDLETYFLIRSSSDGISSMTGSVSIPPWSPGLNCRDVELPVRATKPYVFSALEHPVSYGNAYSSDAVTTWVANVTTSGFKLCVEELRDFWEDQDGFRSESNAHWVAIYV